MRQLHEDLEIFLSTELFDKADDNEEAEFYFDDEPLERILYGTDLHGPSSAHLYLTGRKYVQKIITACREERVSDVISAAFELAGSGIAVSTEMHYKIAEAIGGFFPYYPNPVMKYDLLPLKPLFEKMWVTALERNDVYFSDKAGSLLFRWYEHNGEYEKAREVLTRLVEICRQTNNISGEAIYLNNLGFEYLLEKQWSDAIPFFEKAERIFKELDITFEGVNARANYWICRFELNDLDIESIETELKEILRIFNGYGRWYERKPLILLAKIEEGRGNIDKAMELVKKAIESAGNSNTRYPEMDRVYLDHLKNVLNKRRDDFHR